MGTSGTPQTWPLTRRSQNALCAHGSVQLVAGVGASVERLGGPTHRSHTWFTLLHIRLPYPAI